MKTYSCWNRTTLSPSEWAWLSDSGSFMRRLTTHGVMDAMICVLREEWQVPDRLERERLGVAARQLAWVREVLIHSGTKNWMFARTVVPADALVGHFHTLKQLKNRALGTVLFNHPQVIRSAFDYFSCEKQLVGRRSLFTLRNKSLLLSEIFLPDIATL